LIALRTLLTPRPRFTPRAGVAGRPGRTSVARRTSITHPSARTWKTVLAIGAAPSLFSHRPCWAFARSQYERERRQQLSSLEHRCPLRDAGTYGTAAAAHKASAATKRRGC
jgi:hypothetical protein